MQAPNIEARLSIAISGVVQGVGFRPFVYGLARRNRLTGFVRNSNGSVEIEVQGSRRSIETFLRNLTDEAPPLAEIARIETSATTTKHEREFRIEQSTDSFAGYKVVPADAATCDACLDELFDPENRRYRYPFINCTNCGPRFTIIKSLPYDRHATTMAPFAMCRRCQSEYDDPSDRRFHAQPNACRDCGPVLTRIFGESLSTNDDALNLSLKQLRDGDVVALKGLGGFHLVCDAQNRDAIQKLRQRKSRFKKAFALMMVDLEMVRLYCKLSSQEECALLDSSRPIVILERLAESLIPDEVSPGTDRLGVMLPYTPLHHLIMHDYGGPLVATSANLSDEPIVIDNTDARIRLSQIADGFLEHNRDISSRYDDSVIQIVGTKKVISRRSRGLAPLPVRLPFKATQTVLAFGGHLKSTFCFIHDDQAFISQHIGDLENMETEAHFQSALSNYMEIFDLHPQIISHDLHPDYLSTAVAEAFAQKHNLPVIPVQHHHAHIVACMAEHELTDRVIGVAFDGLGYGSDGTLWGGEFLIANLKVSQRLAYLEPVPLPGGTQAIRQPWRMALSYIMNRESGDLDQFAPFLNDLSIKHGSAAVELVEKQILKKLNSPLTSSCGRLFDALSAVLGVCSIAEYEGQAAIELEALASREMNFDTIDRYCHKVYPYQISDAAPHVVYTRSILKAAHHDLLKQTPITEISLKFHITIAQIIHDVCSRLHERTGIDTICLGGGVFQNGLLLSLTRQLLLNSGLKVYFPERIPANDGGLSFGQAVVAAASAQAILISKL